MGKDRVRGEEVQLSGIFGVWGPDIGGRGFNVLSVICIFMMYVTCKVFV